VAPVSDSPKTPDEILADFMEMMDLMWRDYLKPKEWYMSKSQAALFVDVSRIPDGSIVVLREGGYVGILEDEDV
jgi:hypothetical protein